MQNLAGRAEQNGKEWWEYLHLGEKENKLQNGMVLNSVGCVAFWVFWL